MRESLGYAQGVRKVRDKMMYLLSTEYSLRVHMLIFSRAVINPLPCKVLWTTCYRRNNNTLGRRRQFSGLRERLVLVLVFSPALCYEMRV